MIFFKSKIGMLMFFWKKLKEFDMYYIWKDRNLRCRIFFILRSCEASTETTWELKDDTMDVYFWSLCLNQVNFEDKFFFKGGECEYQSL